MLLELPLLLLLGQKFGAIAMGNIVGIFCVSSPTTIVKLSSVLLTPFACQTFFCLLLLLLPGVKALLPAGAGAEEVT